MTDPASETGRTRVHTYWPAAGEHETKVAALFLPSNASAQVSALTEEDGFLIRVWPPNGTHEFGGDNGTVASIVVRFDSDGLARFEKVEAHQGWPTTTTSRGPNHSDGTS